MLRSIVEVTKVEKAKSANGTAGFRVHFTKKGWDYKRWISEREAEKLGVDEDMPSRPDPYLWCVDLGMDGEYRNFQFLKVTNGE